MKQTIEVEQCIRIGRIVPANIPQVWKYALRTSVGNLSGLTNIWLLRRISDVETEEDHPAGHQTKFCLRHADDTFEILKRSELQRTFIVINSFSRKSSSPRRQKVTTVHRF